MPSSYTTPREASLGKVNRISTGSCLSFFWYLPIRLKSENYLGISFKWITPASDYTFPPISMKVGKGWKVHLSPSVRTKYFCQKYFYLNRFIEINVLAEMRIFLMVDVLDCPIIDKKQQ